MSNSQAAFNYLLDKGYSPAAAAGIVGNLVQESGVNPTVRPGDNGTAHGIAQWRGDRYTGLQDYARKRDANSGDLSLQLDYLDQELKNKYGSTYKNVMAAQTPRDAAAAFALGYERPKGAETGVASNVDGWANRLAAANAFMKNGTVSDRIQQPSAPTQLTGGLLANPVAASPMARPQIGGLLDYAKITAPPAAQQPIEGEMVRPANIKPHMPDPRIMALLKRQLSIGDSYV